MTDNEKLEKTTASTTDVAPINSQLSMLEIKNLCRTYTPKSGVAVKALDDVSLRIEDKGMVFVLGKSGSGKSTLLNVLGGLDKYDSGELIICGKSSKDFSQSDFDSYRNTYIGFIFQEYNILDEFTVGQNIALAMQLQGKKVTNEALNAILEQVDLVGYENRKPNELSGGQKQRVAIARALIKDPQIIMADEPTGALDSNTGKQVFDTLKKLSKDKLVLIVSHDRDFAEIYADRIVEFADGRIISDNIKYLAPATVAGEGLKIVDNKIIQIKKGYALTSVDLKLINDYLSKNTDDTIISLDGKSNAEIKRISKLTDSGDREAFRDTTDKDIDTKGYSSSDFKTIKSKLPLKNSLKIAASSLKSKPVRLFFTILLSAIAFAMFGLVSTFAFYDKTTTATQSIIDTKTDYISFSKAVKEGSADYFSETKLSDADLATLKKQFPDLDFIPIFSGTNNSFIDLRYESNVKKTTDMGKYYKPGYSTSIAFSGIAEITNEQLTALGYPLIGRLPSANNEIAITQYAYEHFAVGGYISTNLTPTVSIDNVSQPSQIIGQKLSLTGIQYTIVGIVDTLFDGEKYSSFKNASESSNDLASSFKSMALASDINDSLTNVCFVNQGLISSLKGNTDLLSQSGRSTPNLRLEYRAEGSDPMSFNFYSVLPASKLTTDNSVSLGIPTSGYNLTIPAITLINNGSALVNDFSNLISTEFNSLSNAYFTYNELPDEFKIANISTIVDQHYTTENGYPSFSSYTESDCISMYKYYLADARQDASWSGGWYNNNYKTAHYTESGSALQTRMSNQAIKNAVEAASSELLALNLTMKIESFDYETGSQVSSEQAVKISGVTYLDYSSYVPDPSRGFEFFIPYNAAEYWGMADDTATTLKFSSGGYYDMAVASTPSSADDVLDIVEYSYAEHDNNTVRYILSNPSTVMLDWVNSLIEVLSQVFLYVGIGFAVFAAFLLMNFIATSISYKKRDIGILRALGARGADVFGIFFNESLIIAFINFVIALIMTIATVVTLNKVIINAGIAIKILNFGIIQILIMITISICVAFFSSFLPVYKTARKRPIDAIREK